MKLIYFYKFLIDHFMLWIIFLLTNDLISKTLGKECQCGKNRINERVKRIHNGENAQMGQYPWQIHLQIQYFQNVYENNIFFDKYYGGVLISKKHILTCASCMEDFFTIRIEEDDDQLIQGIASAGVHDVRNLKFVRHQDNDYGIQFRMFYKDDIHIHEGLTCYLFCARN